MSLFKRLFGRRREAEATKEEREVEPFEVPAKQSNQVDTSPLRGGQTRPLPPLEEVRFSSRRLTYGQSTDVGMVRANNQDALFTQTAVIESAESLPTFGVFIVADGMGGHTEGERASMIAAKTLARHILDQIYMPMLFDNEPSSEQHTIPEVLEEGMMLADEEVKQAVPDGGTTLTAAVIHGNLLYVAHVGDSRAYLINNGSMELITRDHSLARRLQEIGHLSADEAETYPQKNVLYKAIGQGDALEDVDRATRRLLPGTRLLLCSDGLWGSLDDELILKTTEEAADVQEACDQLIALANQAGGPDNVTAVLVEMPA